MIGIIILNYNTPKETIKCIDSIKEKSDEKYHIYIVDNASTDGSSDKFKKLYSNNTNISIIISSTNLGYSGGNNLGICQALKDKVDYILIVNSDVVFDNDVPHILKEALCKNVSIVGPRVIKTDGSDGQQLIHTYNFKYAVIDRQPFHSITKALKIPNLHIKPKDTNMIFYGMVIGACFLIKSDIIRDKMGGKLFDDNVFLYSEERILSIRLSKMNLEVMYCPSAVIHHMEGKSTGGSNPFADYHRYASDYYCIVKYGNLNNIQKEIIRFMRLFNFNLKALTNKEYKERYKMLKIKFSEIDKGYYKINY